jgi:hypothetical protein
MRRSIVSGGIFRLFRLFLLFPVIVVSFDVPQDLPDVQLAVGERSDDVLNFVAEDSSI